MPHSYGYYKQEIKEHFLRNIDVKSQILDVGPGCGTYATLLSPHYNNIDAVEIFPDYVTRYNLKELYRHVFVTNILNFDFSKYDYLIFGDVLEHIDVLSAQIILNQIELNHQKCLVAVPYMFEQSESEGNPHEAHLQPDLTHELFLERYPSMSVIYRNDYYGYYCNYKFTNDQTDLEFVKQQVADILREKQI